MQNHHTTNTYNLSREKAFTEKYRSIDTGLLSEDDRKKYILGFGAEGGNFEGDTRIPSSYSRKESEQRSLNRLKRSYQPYQEEEQTKEKKRRKYLLVVADSALADSAPESQPNTTPKNYFQQNTLSTRRESLLDLLEAAKVIETNATSKQPSNITIQTYSQSLGMPYSAVLSGGL